MQLCSQLQTFIALVEFNCVYKLRSFDTSIVISANSFCYRFLNTQNNWMKMAHFTVKAKNTFLQQPISGDLVIYLLCLNASTPATAMARGQKQLLVINSRIHSLIMTKLTCYLLFDLFKVLTAYIMSLDRYECRLLLHMTVRQ